MYGAISQNRDSKKRNIFVGGKNKWAHSLNRLSVRYLLDTSKKTVMELEDLLFGGKIVIVHIAPIIHFQVTYLQ